MYNTEAVDAGRYQTIGQLIGASILINGRGPECFHPAFIRALFGVKQPSLIEEINDGLIKEGLNLIDQGKYDVLYERDINPIGKDATELKRLFLLDALVYSKSSAIQQLKKGISSICPNLLHEENFQEMKKLFAYSVVEYTFEQIVSEIIYPQTKNGSIEQGSNLGNEIRCAIADFEMILLNIGQKNVFITPDVPMKYTDLLFFITASDRLPSWGLSSKIEVDFSSNTTFPNSHTCGFLFHLPLKVVESQIVNAVAHGVGFGFV